MKTKEIIRKIKQKVLPNLKYLKESRIRKCRCCEKRSLIVSLSRGEEYKLCIRCGANLRYEMLATCIRRRWPDLSQLSVIELDPGSPLSRLFKDSGSYLKTYYSQNDSKGVIRQDGARCEDLTALTLDDNSVDLMISSDVLEHVPDLRTAFFEMTRVLRTGGVHLFTVPTREHTQRRAEVVNGALKHLMEPEYHSDPLNPEGILAFWDFGRDAPDTFDTEHLKLGIVAGPEGKDARVVWEARRY